MSQPATLTAALNLLAQHNAWRRGVSDDPKPTDARELGAAIDLVCEVVPELLAALEQITPGPWVVFDPGQHGAAYGIEGSDGTAVCWYGITHENGIRRLEDARLIAAAPELLAACLIAMPVGVCLTNSNVPDSTVVPVDFTMRELRQIAAAIAKATGGAA